jgi:DNA polymerase-3 subunit delta'
LASIERMLEGGAPQALLLIGPASIGKTTLALDLAAGLLCAADDEGARPCRACRACRLVASGTHQDLHRLAPEGAGRQVRIGDPSDPEPGTVRHLIRELARLPVEGRRRVAVIEGAHRMNEDAQNALLKTLEEPPAGATLILCADEPERLLLTVRSRAATLRLGPLGIRAIEGLLGERGVDPPRAARLARLAGGRPGLALAYAAAPQAVNAREEISRTLLDLVAESRSRRLVVGRELLARAAELASLRDDPGAAGARPAEARPAEAGASDAPPAPVPHVDEEDQAGKPVRSSPAERRLAAGALIETWAAVARDLAVVAAGGSSRAMNIALVDDLEATAARIPAGAVPAFLARLARAAQLLEANANPELVVDVLVLAWPRAA